MLKLFFLQNYVLVADLFEKYSALTGLVGVIIGILLSWVVNFIRDYYRFDKEKRGAIKIINAEIEVNLNSLKKFKDNYLIDFTNDPDYISFQEIKEFYMHLEKFPCFSHVSWNNLLRFVPSIYTENQINRIIEFNKNLDDLYALSKALSNHQEPIETNDQNFMLIDVDYDGWDDFIGDHVVFERQLFSVIEDGELILEFSKK